jgi:hypothetical protein
MGRGTETKDLRRVLGGELNRRGAEAQRNAENGGVWGFGDAYLAKYDGQGNVAWIAQLGSDADESARGVAVDGSGNVYITGQTNGQLGETQSGGTDAFLAKYDAAGNLAWTRQWGTAESDSAGDVAVDSAGNTYITGGTAGSLGGTLAGESDLFLTKYDTDGNLVWARQLGGDGHDAGIGLVVDSSGDVIITGSTSSSFGGANAGGSDVLLAKYDAGGNHMWTRLLGSDGDDVGWDIAFDASGDLFIAGITDGGLGAIPADTAAGYLAKCDSAGNLLWATQQSVTITVTFTNRPGTYTYAADECHGVALDASGSAYVTGTKRGYDWDEGTTLVAKYEVTEPATVAVLGIGCVGVMRRRRAG